MDKTYRTLSFELRASDIGVMIKDFLVANKDIAANVQMGKPISASDKKRIASYVMTKISNGKLTLGLQSNQGNLHFVTRAAHSRRHTPQVGVANHLERPSPRL